MTENQSMQDPPIITFLQEQERSLIYNLQQYSSLKYWRKKEGAIGKLEYNLKHILKALPEALLSMKVGIFLEEYSGNFDYAMADNKLHSESSSRNVRDTTEMLGKLHVSNQCLSPAK